MPKAYKTVGQASPTAATDVALYTVPSMTQFIASTLTVCNRDASAPAHYRVAVVPFQASLGNEHYVFYDRPVNCRDTNTHSLGLSLQPGDKLYIWASSGQLSFSLFGVEMS